MLGFKGYLEEAKQEVLTSKEHSKLYDFLHHLSSPTLDGGSLKEAHDVETIRASGLENKPEGNLFGHMKAGFHAAFPEGETEQETESRGLEARKHFRNFMTERGGHSKKNVLQLTGENGKTRLSTGANVQTLGLSLAPHTSSGYKQNLCPKASAECAENCLGFTAGGNKQYPEADFRAKLLRTQYVAEHPEHAARLMSREIGENEKWSDKHGYKSGFRANVLSDIPYEKMMPSKFYERHAKTQFYDYTKVAARLKNPKDLPSNYSLALSHIGTGHDESNDKDVVEHLNRGGVVAMVYQKGKITPTHVEDVKTGKRYPIVNGDKDDNVYDRHKQAGVPTTQGVVSGLKLKGVTNEAAGKFANPVDDDGIIRINK